jgi:glycosyltransferase involved in cell wall biosynthesis
LPIFIVDDGSDGPTKEALSEIRATMTEVRLLTRLKNGGKGAALKDGFRSAFNAGHTHALQLDADRQHDTEDIQKFLALGKVFPKTMICGEPVYDSTIPKSRLYGRKITNFWVALETLSLNVPDAMCGFRLYPLIETLFLIDSCSIGDRMEYDIEILVHFIWEGWPVEWIKTKVQYPVGGHSNFRMFRDNLRISWAHTRLMTGMILNLPDVFKKRSKTGHTIE